MVDFLAKLGADKDFLCLLILCDFFFGFVTLAIVLLHLRLFFFFLASYITLVSFSILINTIHPLLFGKKKTLLQ